MNILTEIIEVKKEEVRNLKKQFSLNSFKEMEFFERKSLNFSNNLNSNHHLSIIAEIKKASPSKGILRENFNHQKIAEIYFKEGIDAVSILTDKNYFKGDINFLSDIAKFKEAPLLRKDFIIDEYQIFESKAKGADIILLIAEALSKNQINDLTSAAYELGLDVLLELHSFQQTEKIDFSLNKLIGINNRNLEDFSVSLDTTLKISEKLPENLNIITESGINKKVDINLLKNYNVKGILVGEFLMKAGDIKSGLRELKEWCELEN